MTCAKCKNDVKTFEFQNNEHDPICENCLQDFEQEGYICDRCQKIVVGTWDFSRWMNGEDEMGSICYDCQGDLHSCISCVTVSAYLRDFVKHEDDKGKEYLTCKAICGGKPLD